MTTTTRIIVHVLNLRSMDGSVQTCSRCYQDNRNGERFWGEIIGAYVDVHVDGVTGNESLHLACLNEHVNRNPGWEISWEVIENSPISWSEVRTLAERPFQREQRRLALLGRYVLVTRVRKVGSRYYYSWRSR